ncbi:hypothetical protein OTU49_005910, partial [Cherax quadricarinatus]
AYVGDSRIRQHLEVLLDLIRSLQPRITTHLGEVITVETFLGEEGLKNWRKYKHNFRVECSQAPGLIVDFHWAAFIDRGQTPRNEGDVMVGALDLLHRWIKAPQDQIPDIIVLTDRRGSCKCDEYTAASSAKSVNPCYSGLGFA